MQDYKTQAVKFDYVVNDLSEYLLDTDTGKEHEFLRTRQGFPRLSPVLANLILHPYPTCGIDKPEDHWSCIAHLSAEDMLKSVVIEEKK